MRSSLTEYITQSASTRVERFYSLCFPVCDFIEKQHRKGKVLLRLNPDVIHVDSQTKQVELIYNSSEIDRFFPYISPEQTGRINRQVDYRSDLYSLGVVFYELLTGELPFRAEDALGWSYVHVTTEPKPPNKLNADIPLVLSDIIMKLLNKSPDERYQSIVGLCADLKRCCVEEQATGKVEPFILGQMDVSERLQFQTRLFGRDKETAILMEAYDRVCRGSTESVIISGYLGVGKTALVNEFKSKIIYSKGYFTHGRFSQSQHDTAYLAIIQAIRELVEQIIIDRWQEKIDWEKMSRGMLDADEGILIQTILELQRLIEEDLLSSDSFEDRLLELSRCLLQTIFRAEHPVVVFLDDLQWLDPASVKLIQSLLTDASEGRVLFIGVYDTNEIDQIHPVFSVIQSLEDQRIPVMHLALRALNLNSTQELVADILKCKGKDVVSFACGIFYKSAGNPLYVKQIIQHLYEEGDLYFSFEEWCWKYKDGGLRNIVLQERVVELVLERIPELPAETIDLLKLSSCLGREFNSEILSIALNRSVDWIRQILEPAIDLGIIAEQSGLDAARDLADHGENTDSQGGSFACFEFLHDRVVEAIYSLMSDEEKKIAHLRVGRAILQKSDLMPDGDIILAAVDHLNCGMELMDDERERIKLAEYNLKAAREAKVSNESTVLLQYLEAGMKLLPENSWNSCYRLTFDLYVEYYRCRFLRDGFSAAEPMFKLLIRKAESQSDRIEIYCQKTVLCVGYYTDEEAILSGLSALRLMGLRIPIVPDKRYLMKEILYIRLRLFGRRIESLLHYPEMRNDRAKKIITVLATLIPPASLSNPELFNYIMLKMTSISLKYGNTDYSAFGYACYGFVCSQFGDVRKAMKLRDISLSLAERSSNCASKCTVYYTIAVYFNHWGTHLSHSLDYAEKAHIYARESGDALLVGSIQTEMVQMRYMMGESLRVISSQNTIALAENMLYDMPDLLDILHTVNQYIRNLKGDTFDPFTFSSAEYDEDTVAGRMIRTNSGIIVPFYYLMKMQSYYLHGNFRNAFLIALQHQSKLDLIVGKMLYAEHVYWACLAASAVYVELESSNKKKAKKLWQQNIRLLQRWSRMCEANFLHKYSLVSAEQHRLSGNTQKAMTLYEKAIVLAQKYGYILDAAVACERTAEYYLELGFEQNAQAHMVNACKLYAEFGATLKLKLLRAKYPEMLAEVERVLVLKEEDEVENNADGQQRSADEKIAEDLRVISEICQSVDALALSEVSNSFLEYSDFDDVVKKLVDVIVKSAGAQRAYLMEVRGDSIAVIARKESGHEPAICCGKESNNDYRLFSHSVVMYVVNTGRPVMLDDSAQKALFGKDRYLRESRAKSVLCLPISSQDCLVGILYLENNLTTRVFSVERIGILEKLALQSINTWKLALVLGKKDTSNIKARDGAVVSLTEKETRIIELMVEGLSNLEIADRMHLSEGTVKWHSNKIFKKLGVRSRTQAVLRVNELRALQRYT